MNYKSCTDVIYEPFNNMTDSLPMYKKKIYGEPDSLMFKKNINSKKLISILTKR